MGATVYRPLDWRFGWSRHGVFVFSVSYHHATFFLVWGIACLFALRTSVVQYRVAQGPNVTQHFELCSLLELDQVSTTFFITMLFRNHRNMKLNCQCFLFFWPENVWEARFCCKCYFLYVAMDCVISRRGGPILLVRFIVGKCSFCVRIDGQCHFWPWEPSMFFGFCLNTAGFCFVFCSKFRDPACCAHVLFCLYCSSSIFSAMFRFTVSVFVLGLQAKKRATMLLAVVLSVSLLAAFVQGG